MFLSYKVSDRNYITNLQNFFEYANNIFTIFGITKYIAMEITLLKNHLDHTAGETIEVTEDRGNYLLRTKVAKEAKKKSIDDYKAEIIKKKKNRL